MGATYRVNKHKSNKKSEIMSETKKSVFETLNAINVNGHTEKKNGLTYLSWAWAWSEVKKNYPQAFYTIYENKEGLLYHTDGRTCWVKTGVTIEGQEHIEYLPVMDFRNNSIPIDKVTSTDVNKAVQRSLTKACARHGLGLYIYAGEDLPEEEQKAQEQKVTADVANALNEVSESVTIEDLEKVWRRWTVLQQNVTFKMAVIEKKNIINRAS